MDELEVIGRVELRLLTAKTDDAFTQALGVYLVPLLQKLKSPRVDVVSAVLDLIKKLKLRLNPSIKLPVPKLVDTLNASARDVSLAVLRQNSQILAFLSLQPLGPEYTSKVSVGFAEILKEQNEFAIKNAASQLTLFLDSLNAWVETTKNTDVEPLAIDGRDQEALDQILAKLYFVDFSHFTPLKNPGLSRIEANFFEILLGSPNGFVVRGDWLRSVLVLMQKEPEAWKLGLLAASGSSHLDISRGAWLEVGKLLNAYSEDVLLSWALGGGGVRSVDVPLKTNIVELLKRRKAELRDPRMGLLIGDAFRAGDEKLRRNAMELLRTSAESVSVENFTVFVRLLKQYIMDDGWPQSQSRSPKLVLLRQQAYETLGVVLKSGVPDQNIVNFLFQGLERDSGDMASSIQHALADTLEALPSEMALQVRPKLQKSMVSSDSDRIKYVAVRFAVRILPPNDPLSRVICLLGLTSRPDVIEEAKRGLHSKSLPEFPGMLSAVSENAWPPKSNSAANETLGFLLKCLLSDAGGIVEEADVALKLDSRTQDAFRDYTRNHVEEATALMALCFDTFSLSYGSSVEAAVQLWRSLVQLAPRDAWPASVTSEACIKLLNGSYADVAAETLALFTPPPSLDSLLDTDGGYLSAAYLVTSATLKGDAVSADSIERIAKWAVAHADTRIIYTLALSGRLQVNDEIKAVASKKDELAVAALSLSDPSHAEEYATLLSSKTSFKGFDDMLVNGEALSLLAAGLDGNFLRQRHPLLSFESIAGKDNLELVMSKISLKGQVARRISSVRLLCLVQYNRDLLTSHGTLEHVQQQLLSLLNDGDEITQESASRGLGILYEHGSSEAQQALMSELVSSFTGDTSITMKVTAETQLFEPGALRTGEDSSVSTYKDVLSLASEVGDATLVYKFMSLAASSQLWNSRRGAAFGLERIMAQSQLSDEVTQGGPKGQALVPKLYRYRFDPNDKVQRAMKSIWDALVKDTNAVIGRYSSEIYSDLAKGCISREWRTREASTAGLANLVQTHWDTLAPYAGELWKIAFRVADDIKESVRNVGMELTKALTTALLRKLERKEQSSLKTDTELLQNLVPFLMGTQGLQSNSDEVRSSSVSTILKIIAINTPAFEPLALSVFSELCLLLSVLEPQAMNYIALNAGKYGMSSTDVDESRAKAIRRSPIMESLELLCERFEGAQLQQFISSTLPDLVKQSVGLPSKLGVARLIVLACMRFPRDVAFGPLFTACINQLWGINDVISQAFAEACGYISRLEPLDGVLQYINILRDAYFKSESDSERKRLIVAHAVQSFSRHGSDQFSKTAASILPLAFVGQFDPEEKTSKIFKEVWNSNTGGTASVKLYRDEILQATVPLLQSAARNLQVSAANAILDIATADPKKDTPLLEALLPALAGRSWQGKEIIFKAFVEVAIQEPSIPDPVVDRVKNEAARRNMDYKIAILPSVGKFLSVHKSKDLEDLFLSESAAILEDADKPVDEKVTVFNGVVASKLLNDKVLDIFKVLATHWKLRLAACDAMAHLSTEGIFNPDVWNVVTSTCARDEAYETVRLAWAKAAVASKSFISLDQIAPIAVHEQSDVVLSELRRGFNI